MLDIFQRHLLQVLNGLGEIALCQELRTDEVVEVVGIAIRLTENILLQRIFRIAVEVLEIGEELLSRGLFDGVVVILTAVERVPFAGVAILRIDAQQGDGQVLVACLLVAR